MSLSSGYSSNVLTVKNFPLLFNDYDRREFLEHFGAIRIHYLSRFNHTSNLIIADFGSHSQASQALRRLHQLELLTRRLVVEYCPIELAQISFPRHEYTGNQIEYASPSQQNLVYRYSPMNETILSHINNALLSVPSFYMQVLQLMNKMSLPCSMIADSKTMHRTSSISSVACQTDSAFHTEKQKKTND